MLAAVRSIRKILAGMLLALWPVLTSHTLLERVGVIHELHLDHQDQSGTGSHEHNADNHDFADGDYWIKSRSELNLNSQLHFVSQISWLVPSLASLGLAEFTGSGPAPPGLAPLEFHSSLNFLLRTALQPRAPSLLS